MVNDLKDYQFRVLTLFNQEIVLDHKNQTIHYVDDAEDDTHQEYNLIVDIYKSGQLVKSIQVSNHSSKAIYDAIMRTLDSMKTNSEKEGT